MTAEKSLPSSNEPTSNTRPIIFLGPSMPLEEARLLLPNADYRPPAQRGDLDVLPAGAVVGLIDGRFEQVLAVSPREVHNAVKRGVLILASSSMGALRASEVLGVEGVGRVYEMYRDGVIDRDDEVALIFDDERFQPYTVPLVNIRYSVQCLVSVGTIDAAVGKKIIRAAQQMHYTDRRYKHILRRAGLHDRADTEHLLTLLASYDLKKDDAHLLLEQMPSFFKRCRNSPVASGSSASSSDDVYNDALAGARLEAQLDASAPLLVWEYGDSVAFDDVITFLKMTGEFGHHARQAVARFVLSGRALKVEAPSELRGVPLLDRGDLLAAVCENWGWSSSEELKVTLRDLGMGYGALRACLLEEAAAQRSLAGLVQSRDFNFATSLRAQLLMDKLSLKRAILRSSSVAYFAERSRASKEPLNEAQRRDARSVLHHINRAYPLQVLAERLARQDVSRDQLDGFVEELAHARRGAADVAQALWGLRPSPIVPVKLSAKLKKALRVARSRKAPDSRRFCMPMAEAQKHATRMAKIIGVTRVGLVGELTSLGVQISQAYRPHGTWSSTAGSGKGYTRASARVGGVMEEIEKYAQEQFTYQSIVGTYSEIRAKELALDPSTLDLPYDSAYDANLEIAWGACVDLLSGQQIYVPAAFLDRKRLLNDICYSRRLGRKIFSTNGLASGFTAAEALLHALCEYIERHAVYLAELLLQNPGRLGGPTGFTAIDLDTLPKSSGPARLVRSFRRASFDVRLLDITSEVKVPTLYAIISDGGAVSVGHAAHPDPQVAAEMALFEAAQTVIGNASGAREDLTIKARSLGRHERPHPRHADAEAMRHGRWHIAGSFADIAGFLSKDVLAEVEWVLGCLTAAKIERALAVPLAVPELPVAHIFRVLIPGLETPNPFRVGPRARAQSLRQLLDPARFDPLL